MDNQSLKNDCSISACSMVAPCNSSTVQWWNPLVRLWLWSFTTKFSAFENLEFIVKLFFWASKESIAMCFISRILCVSSLNMSLRLQVYFIFSCNPKLFSPLLLVIHSTMYPPSLTSSIGSKSPLERAWTLILMILISKLQLLLLLKHVAIHL